MKNRQYRISIIIILCLSILAIGSLSAQTIWKKYEGNPVLSAGPAGTWDDTEVYRPWVIYDPDSALYYMWYVGWNGNVVSAGAELIGLATSPDGIHWTKDTVNNPVLENGPVGSWDHWNVGVPVVLRDGTGYQMWYTGVDSTGYAENGYYLRQTGRATSSDGIIWEKDSLNNPVMTIDTTSDFLYRFITISSAYFDGSEYQA